MVDGSFTVLIVCTANQCRSPMAELLLAQGVADRNLGWSIRSAGTRAQTGEPIHPHAGRALASRGIDSEDWRSSRLTADLVSEADLILAAASTHRRDIVTRWPRALPKAFLFREFVRLRSYVPDLDARAPTEMVRAVAAMRSHTVAASRGDDDVADPIGKRQRIFDRCCAELAAGVTVIAGTRQTIDLR